MVEEALRDTERKSAVPSLEVLPCTGGDRRLLRSMMISMTAVRTWSHESREEEGSSCVGRSGMSKNAGEGFLKDTKPELPFRW